MLSNMRLAAPEVDSALVELLSRWTLRGRHGSPEPKVPAHCILCWLESEPIHSAGLHASAGPD